MVELGLRHPRSPQPGERLMEHETTLDAHDRQLILGLLERYINTQIETEQNRMQEIEDLRLYGLKRHATQPDE